MVDIWPSAQGIRLACSYGVFENLIILELCLVVSVVCSECQVHMNENSPEFLIS